MKVIPLSSIEEGGHSPPRVKIHKFTNSLHDRANINTNTMYEVQSKTESNFMLLLLSKVTSSRADSVQLGEVQSDVAVLLLSGVANVLGLA